MDLVLLGRNIQEALEALVLPPLPPVPPPPPVSTHAVQPAPFEVESIVTRILFELNFWCWIRFCSTCKSIKQIFTNSFELKYQFQVLAILYYFRMVPPLCWQAFRRVERGFIGVRSIRPRFRVPNKKRRRDEPQLEPQLEPSFDPEQVDVQQFLDENFVSDLVPVTLGSLVKQVIKVKDSDLLSFLIIGIRILMNFDTYFEEKYKDTFKLAFEGPGKEISLNMYHLISNAVKDNDLKGFALYVRDPRTNLHLIAMRAIEADKCEMFNWLLAQPGLDPRENDFELVRRAIQLERWVQTDLLLKDERVKEFVESGQAEEELKLVKLGKVMGQLGKL